MADSNICSARGKISLQTNAVATFRVLHIKHTRDWRKLILFIRSRVSVFWLADYLLYYADTREECADDLSASWIRQLVVNALTIGPKPKSLKRRFSQNQALATVQCRPRFSWSNLNIESHFVKSRMEFRNYNGFNYDPF